MNYIELEMPEVKRIALVAHDNKKAELLDWVKYNEGFLSNHILCGTGSTASLIKSQTNLDIEVLKSGPLGGDAQIAAKIANGDLDMLIFFWDGLTAQPHEVDVKMLLRISTIYNILTACNKSSADFLVSSILHNEKYLRQLSYDVLK